MRININNWDIQNIFKYWLITAIILCGLCLIVYTVVQQDLRQSANDPQIQMAEDAAAQLGAGQPVQAVVPAQTVDIATSLAPYLIVFDNNGNPIASSARLNGQIPTIPSGVFDYVRQNGEDRITWQPQAGVRSAIVVTQFKGSRSGFVAAGRSLREVEIRESETLQLCLLGLVGLLFVTFIAIGVLFGRRSGWHIPANHLPHD